MTASDSPARRWHARLTRFGRVAWVVVVLPIWRTVLRLIRHDGPELAGYMAFNALLALFPFLIFLMALSGFLGQADSVQDFIGFAFEYLPVEVGRVLFPVVTGVALAHPQGGLLTISMIGTLWVASSGLEAIRTGLDRAYGVPDRRPFWWRRLQGLAFVVSGAIAILIVMLLIVAGPLLWDLFLYVLRQVALAGELDVGLDFTQLEDWNTIYNAGRYGAGALGLFLVICVLYRYLPNIRHRWLNVLPGAMVSSAAWLFVATVYSFYLGNITDYSAIYGGLGGVIGALIFFFVSALIFLFGAELNATLMQIERKQAIDGAEIEERLDEWDDMHEADEAAIGNVGARDDDR